MQRIERIILKIIVIQLIFLIVSQLLLHQLDFIPELERLSQYEGVTDQNFTNFLETFNKEK